MLKGDPRARESVCVCLKKSLCLVILCSLKVPAFYFYFMLRTFLNTTGYAYAQVHPHTWLASFILSSFFFFVTHSLLATPPCWLLTLPNSAIW